MKTVKIKLSNEAKADRGLQMTELACFLTKETDSDWQEQSDNELVEYEQQDNGNVNSINWSVSKGRPNSEGTFTFDLDC